MTKPTFQQKVSGIFKLIRPNNIIPSTLLTFSGGWIMNPSLNNLIHSPQFAVIGIDTILIMSTSMIINDIFDIQTDKINNPDRPLITGDIKVTEAFAVSTILLTISEYLSTTYLSSNLQTIINFTILDIILYTPVLKKITFIKNLACAGLVGISVFVAGLSTADTLILDVNNLNLNTELLLIATQIIFFGSLYIEILLDICDVEGDKQSGINTIPVVYEKDTAFQFVNNISKFNILLCFIELSIISNLQYGLILLVLCSPLDRSLKDIKNDYNKETIVKTVKNTTIPMFLILIYLCILSGLQNNI